VTEADLKILYETQKPALNEWGLFVLNAIMAGLRSSIGEEKLKTLLKISPEPRVKETNTFLSKALQRKKYENPMEQITDKVGLRFVVLLRSEISLIEAVIESGHWWDFKKDRDFAAECAARPQHFDYQSVHYVVRALKPINVNAINIPAGLACEIQVRTLLQHAYAELAHDRIYKRSDIVETQTLRHVAKSAALVETTDEIFQIVDDTLEASVAQIKALHAMLIEHYQSFVQLAPSKDVGFSRLVAGVYAQFVETMSESALREFLGENDFIGDKIRERFDFSVLYHQPAILFIYYLVETEPNELWKRWPFNLDHLNVIYSDMGVSTAGRQ
jgi:ppGpp synthetase/RelA/SpoT-type nucleotidyltranferase